MFWQVLPYAVTINRPMPSERVSASDGIALEQGWDMKKPKILFVCLGNICRSPMAEYILRRRAAEAGIPPRNGQRRDIGLARRRGYAP